MSNECENESVNEGVEDQIIDLVEKYPILYNVNDPDYMRVDKKNEAWNKIHAELNLSEMTAVDKIKKKWRSIKCAYQTSKKKLPSGSKAGRKKQYRRNLTFLDPYSVESQSDRESSIVLSLNMEQSEILDELNVELPPSSIVNRNIEIDSADMIFESSESPFCQTPSTSASEGRRSNTSSSRRSSKQDDSSQISTRIDNLLETIEKNWSDLNSSQESDSVSLYCDSLKSSLKSLSQQKLLMCQAEILQVIAKYMDN
uniref:CSON004615 protein n=1 Tax=Culicoides sonorensis TaxID=179676 RepID=A0A336KNZ0_CULSO